MYLCFRIVLFYLLILVPLSNDYQEKDITTKISDEIMEIGNRREHLFREDLTKKILNLGFGEFYQKLAQERQSWKDKEISQQQIVQLEIDIINGLSKRIREEISIVDSVTVTWDNIFNIMLNQGEDLYTILETKMASSFGYTKLFFILGNAIGLSVEPIEVRELVNHEPLKGKSYLACLIKLSDDRKVMIDLALPIMMISKPFALEEVFLIESNYWEIRNKDNPLGLHRRMRILDNKGLRAYNYIIESRDYLDIKLLDLAESKCISCVRSAISGFQID